MGQTSFGETWLVQIWFILLSASYSRAGYGWSSLTRLETRTKESTSYASFLVIETKGRTERD